MESRRFRTAARLAGSAAAGLLLSTALTHAALAQPPAPTPVPPPSERSPALRDPISATRERQGREAALRSLDPRAAPARRTVDPRRIEAAIEKIAEDFRRIQIVRNEIVRQLKADGPLDYAAVSDRAAEINKRANRLKGLLLPPETDEDAKEQKRPAAELDGAGVKTALVELCLRIDNFVENPVFKQPGTVDVQHSAKAGGDLLSIIELSGNVRKSAERLGKTP